MSQELQTAKQNHMAKIEQVLIRGDLSTLAEGERVSYYNRVCETMGLNQLTKPFEYITLNGKLVLYATKGCAEQLRSIHDLSIRITDRQTIEGVYIVTAAAQKANGRVDESTGAVQIAGLKGDNLANAFMKAETKAKRRVTLSICGLNMLDETEVETIVSLPKVKPEQPGPNDGVRTPITSDNIESGKFGGRKVSELGLEDLYWLADNLESKPSPTHHEMRNLERVKAQIETLQNMDPEEAEAKPEAVTTCTCGSELAYSEGKKVFYCKNFKDKNVQHIRAFPAQG